MSVIKSASTFDGTQWGEAIPLGADAVNVAMKQVNSYTVTDNDNVSDSFTEISPNDTLLAFGNKYNYFREILKNKFNTINTTINNINTNINAVSGLSKLTSVTTTAATNNQFYSALAIQNYLKYVIGIYASTSANIIKVDNTNYTTVKGALTALNTKLSTTTNNLANYIPKAGHTIPITGYQYDVTKPVNGFSHMFRFFSNYDIHTPSVKVEHSAALAPGDNPSQGYALTWVGKVVTSKNNSTLQNIYYAQMGGRIYYTSYTTATNKLSSTYTVPMSEIYMQAKGATILDNKIDTINNYLRLGVKSNGEVFVGISNPGVWRNALKIRSGIVKVIGTTNAKVPANNIFPSTVSGSNKTPADDTQAGYGQYVAFGKPLTSTTPVIQCTVTEGAANGSTALTAVITRATTSGFYVKVWKMNASGAALYPNDVNVHWIAMDAYNGTL